MFYFTADEHYGHRNIIKYCDRPFSSVEEMNDTIIDRHNSLISKNDTVIHVGDFTLSKFSYAESILKRLNGRHIFVKGSHDIWLGPKAIQIWEKRLDNNYIVACHYSMRVWPKSHYNSWLLYGHSHGRLPPIGKQWDVGVDNNDFYPVSFTKLIEIMNNSPDNPNKLKKEN